MTQFSIDRYRKERKEAEWPINNSQVDEADITVSEFFHDDRRDTLTCPVRCEHNEESHTDDYDSINVQVLNIGLDLKILLTSQHL